MKLITYQKDGVSSIGAVVGESVYSLGHLFTSMTELISGGEESLYLAKQSILKDKPVAQLSDVFLQAPIPQPVRNVMCVGWNYLNHFEERTNRDIELPERPTFFTKATSSVIGPQDDVNYSEKYSSKLDYEGELAVVIGKKGININEVDAEDYIFGYMVANDVSARDVQFAHGGQWFKGKSMDRSCPIGPYIVTKDEVKDPHNLEISCSVNGVEKQHSNTSHMIFSIPRLISELSDGMTLFSGDILLTGTPEGIGSKRVPPEFLQPGDVVEVSVEGIGEIRNKIKEK